ncbi:MAG: NHL repeat-containing protein [Planctomycetota bacterium]
MNARFVCRPVLLIGLAYALSVGPAALAGGPTDETEIAEIVLYAIDSDTNELLRYSFSTDSIFSMGAVRTSSGTPLSDMEALSYVASGPYKGLYVVPTAGGLARYLVHIDPLTGVATPSASVVVPAGRKLTGMIADYDSGSQTWSLLACEGDDVKSDPDRIEARRLIRIDPQTGVSVAVATLTDGRRFEGLARDSEGQLYAVSRTHFYRVDEDAGAYTVVDLGVTGLNKAEALEFAMGHAQPPVDVPGVGNGWTKFGTLFVFDDKTSRFGVLNPSDGSFVEYLVNGSPSTFATDDAEGMILVTLFDDPLFGTVEGFD